MTIKNPFEEYLEKVLPEELTDSLLALGEKSRLALAAYLADEGEKSFTELRERFSIKNNNTLLNHLDKLEEAGLISNFRKNIEGRSERSFFNASKRDVLFFESLFEAEEVLVGLSEKSETASSPIYSITKDASNASDYTNLELEDMYDSSVVSTEGGCKYERSSL